MRYAAILSCALLCGAAFGSDCAQRVVVKSYVQPVLTHYNFVEVQNVEVQKVKVVKVRNRQPVRNLVKAVGRAVKAPVKVLQRVRVVNKY